MNFNDGDLKDLSRMFLIELSIWRFSLGGLEVSLWNFHVESFYAEHEGPHVSIWSSYVNHMKSANTQKNKNPARPRASL